MACIKMRSGCLSKTARVGGVVNYEKKRGAEGRGGAIILREDFKQSRGNVAARGK